MRVLGLDGCPGGWAGAVVDDGSVTLERFDGLGDGLRAALARDVDLVAVDIPIGLPPLGDRRACDVAARAVLGRRASSVFFAPPRELLGFASHAAATAASVRLTTKGVSIQAWHIYDRIAEVDAVAQEVGQHRLLEVHPEVAFRQLTGADLGSKRRRAGRDRREAAIRQVWDLDAIGTRLPGAKRDDVLDALVCAWTGLRWLRGEALLLPPDPPRDDRGLLTAIAA